VVATSFIGEALIYAYEITNREELLQTAISSTKFVLEDLNKSLDEDSDFTFSYSPLDKTQVYNAGLLGAKLLALVYPHTKDANLLDTAKKVVSYVCKRQTKEGAWTYGTLPFHQWVDNFHTGYNLECIYRYQEISGDLSFQKYINRGLNYYLNTFFTEEGVSKYYNNKTYPIDIHAPAQLIVTLSKLNLLNKNKELADKVLFWTIENMQSPKGFFYYQKRKWLTSQIPYIRWAQSWMFYAFSYYLLESKLDE
jgi:rhamnogalacturonyl hydrolase YesR